jgi:hypothetical protein
LTRASIHLRKNLFQGMDCRVKPGNDGMGCRAAGLISINSHADALSCDCHASKLIDAGLITAARQT